MFLQPCIVLMAALALPGWMSAVSAFPRPEDVSNSGLVVTTTASSATTPQVSTSSVQSTPLPGPPPPPQVRSLHVLSEVQFRYAHTIVSSRVANPADVSQETTFYVVLPETAFISSFAMEIDGKVYKAYVKEKEEAKKTYDAAVASGQAAAHVGVSARDSNSFTVSLNVEPRNKVSFNLTYEELLTRKLGLYEHVITLNPGQVVQDLEVRVHIKENQKIDKLRVPEFTSGNQIAADVQDCEGADCTSNKGSDIATITRKSDYEVEVVFRPTEEDQREIMHKLEAEKKRKALADTDDSQGGDAVAGLLLSMDGSSGGDKDNGLNGQFSVQYDVVRKPDGGEVVVNDGYFVHFFSPVELKPLKKHAIFVLDVSGSMDGRKIEQLREAMTAILGDLKEGDFFTLITFSSDVKALNFDRPERNTVHRPYIHRYYDPENEGQPEQETDRPAPYPATRENIEKAKNIVKTLSAYGGTNINDALKVALDYAREGSRSAAMSNSDQPIEPIILFLTDGDPTVGVTVPAQITAAISDLNLKPRSSIFSLAFGEGADIRFLRKLSLANGGFARNIYEAADASSQLKNFYRQISSPLLANVTFKYLPEKVELDSMTQLHFRSFFAGTELIVAGRLADKGVEEVGGSVSGVTGEGQKATYTSKLVQADEPLSIYPFDVEGPLFNRTVDQAPRKVSVMERLWAYLTIKQLLDKQDALDASTFKEEVIAPPFRPQPPPMPPVALPARDVVESSTDATSTTASSTDLDLSVLNPEPKKKALELALKYSFVTPLTSLVVVKPNETKATDAHAVNPGGQAAGPSVLGAYAGGAGLFRVVPQRPFSNLFQSFGSKRTIHRARASLGKVAPSRARLNSIGSLPRVRPPGLSFDHLVRPEPDQPDVSRSLLVLKSFSESRAEPEGLPVPRAEPEGYSGPRFSPTNWFSPEPVLFYLPSYTPHRPPYAVTILPSQMLAHEDLRGAPPQQASSVAKAEPIMVSASLALSSTSGPQGLDSITAAPDVMTDISDVKWLSQENLQKGFIIIPVNGTDQTLKIARNESEPQPPQACHINGVVTSNVSYSGVCRHFSNCVLSQVVERREDFIKYQCTLGDYLAICCPAEADPTPQSSTPSI